MATRTQEIIDVIDAVLTNQDASPTALAIRDAVKAALSLHSVYSQNWAQFEAQPQAQKPILVSILRVVLQDNRAMAQKLDNLLAQHRQSQGHEGTQRNIRVDGGQVGIIGDGAHIEGGMFFGDVRASGDFAGRDLKKTYIQSPDPAALARAFAKIDEQVAQQTDLAPQDKTDIQTELQGVKQELEKGTEADEGVIRHRLRNVQRMAPDILDVILTTFANPALGLGTVARKIAEKMQAEAE